MSRNIINQGQISKSQSLTVTAQASLSTNSSSLPSHRSAIVSQHARRCLGPAHTSGNYTSHSLPTAQRPGRPQRRNITAAAQAGRGGKGGGTDEEPDWEAEMSIFNQRISRPNQLATLRELEAKVAVGKVLYARDGLAIVSGLNTDAPLGTKVSFATGTAGVLLWHRSDNLSFCLVLGDPASVSEGTPVECKIKGVLQVVDDVKGPVTRKDFEIFNVSGGEDMFGRVCDHIGRHLTEYDEDAAASTSVQPTSRSAATGTAAGGGSSSGSSRFRPLINQQVDMKNREQINESLLTGVKAVDILTPLGRGASLLVIGPGGAGKTQLALDAIAGQARWSGGGSVAAGAAAGGTSELEGAVPSPPGGAVRCVLALVGQPKAKVQAVVSQLRSLGCLSHTAVVAVDDTAPLGHQYAAMCCACSIGERIRDEGGHSLVLVDDIRPLSDVWEQLLGSLAGLGPSLLREGLVKDERGRDVPVIPLPGSADAPAADATSLSSADTSPGAAARPADTASGGSSMDSSSVDDEGVLVEYEGMLVSGAVAQRRGFLSTFFMRAAKMSRSSGGGSMTLMTLVPGTCATGVSRNIRMSKYKTLTSEQLVKLEAALRAKMLAEELAAGASSWELATEVVEEFISIADGQVVLEGPKQRAQQLGQLSLELGQQHQPGSASAASSSSAPAYFVNPMLSVTRIGTRAYYKALEQLAPQVRLDLAQADDARRFGSAAVSTRSAASGSSIDQTSGIGGVRQAAADVCAGALAQRLAAALVQSPGKPVSLAEQVAALYAVQCGFADSVAPEKLPTWLQGALEHVTMRAPAAMQELGRSGILTALVEAELSAALGSFSGAP